jgi:rubredoxin
MTKWRCSVCGYVHDGSEAPEKCPKCGAPKSKFLKLDDASAQLIDKSRLTNEMHMAVASMYKKIQKWARTVKDENLDPNCVMIADRVFRDTEETIRSIKAELQAHMNKGKWG